MSRLTLSLLLVVLTAIIGLDWLMDRFYQRNMESMEDYNLALHKELGAELARLVQLTHTGKEQLDQWNSTSTLDAHLIRYDDFSLPDVLRSEFERGEPLALSSGQDISLNYYLPAFDKVLSFSLPEDRPTTATAMIRLWLTLAFYLGVIALVLVWVYPLLSRLAVLRRTAQRFGAGELGTRIALSNVSYIRDIEREFNRMAQRIETLIQDNKLLSHGVSHDLRTPLARLRFGLEVLQEESLSEPQQDCLEHLMRDASAMEHLVETLLGYARLDQADIQLEPSPVDMGEIVRLAVSGFHDQSIHIVASEFDQPPVLEGDPEYLNMLVHNLIENALRHGKDKVQVALLADADQIELSVEDNGQGIPKADRLKVLKPFTQGSQSGRADGYGMGLAFVERIAYWHQGTISLGRSESLGGLKASIRFPRYPLP